MLNPREGHAQYTYVPRAFLYSRVQRGGILSTLTLVNVICSLIKGQVQEMAPKRDIRVKISTIVHVIHYFLPYLL